MSIGHFRYGEFKIIDTDSVISVSLQLYGEWAQQEINLLAHFIKPGSVVLDVGAFIGTHTRAFSELVGASGKVLSFEPRNATYGVLVENAKLASVDNIQVFNAALGAAEACVKVPSLNFADHSNFGAASLNSMVNQTDTGEKINITTLDAYGLDRLDFMKIDVEGMEIAVLNGAKETVGRCRPVIFAECNSLESGVLIVRWAQKENYQSYGVLSAAYNQHNFAGNTENIFGEAQETGLLLIPAEEYMRHETILLRQQLPQINTADDLALLLLHKPQYPYEVLVNTAASKSLTLLYPSPQADVYRQTLTERDGQIASLTQSVAERDAQIASLTQSVAERDAQIASLTQSVAERDAQIATILTSRSWLITKPMRWVGRLLRGDLSAAYAPIRRFFKQRSTTMAAAHQNKGSDLRVLSLHPIVPTHPLAVIVPVYRDVEMTKRCILAAMPGVLDVPGARLLAINDASPDVGMQSMLEDLEKSWPDVFTVLSNESNQGFVRTVNRGLDYFDRHDVVLLNSDVVVPSDWLQRLRDEAYSIPDAGTITPFTNNGTICSFPNFLQENDPPFELSVEAVDAVFRHFHLQNVEAPTGVGFCMYIRRACLDQIGLLNAERFGRGYGEENDLCQRAFKKGWRNLITPNLYVFHEGGVSFSADKSALVERAMQTIDELHPGYHRDVQNFINSDPLKGARVARYVQLLSTLNVPKILHITHNLGGGVAQHILELAGYLDPRAASLLLTPLKDEAAFSVSLNLNEGADQLLFYRHDYPDMLALLKSAGITGVHIHHTMDVDLKLLKQLLDDLAVRYVMTAHDFYWLNANPTLTDESGNFTGYADDLHNPLYPIPLGYTPQTWRDSLRPLIEGAARLIFPSVSTKTFFSGYYRLDNAIVAPHVELRRNVNTPLVPWVPKKRYVVGILGALGKEKGADYLEKIACLAHQTKKPYDFILIGYAYRSLSNVRITGPYHMRDLSTLIAQNQCDLIFFPALWPETYSYTLSYALESGLPILAPQIGAFPERLSSRPNTLLYQPNMAPDAFLDQLDGFVAAMASSKQPCAPTWQGEMPQNDFYEHAYLGILGADIRVRPASDARPINIPLRNASLGLRTWREEILRVLWQCYMHPRMRWIGKLLPYGLRRATKRFLSRRPIHEVI